MKRINFLFTNDLHGNILAFNTITELKKEIDNPLTIDTGDTFSENFYTNLTAELLKKHIDIWTPGNHDVDIIDSLPQSFLKGIYPTKLSSNITNQKFIENIKDEIILDLSGVKTGFIAISGKGKDQNINYQNQGRVIIHKIKKLRRNVDLLVLLSHVGLNEDIRIAEAAPEIDIIFGGHSHTRLKAPTLINKTLILQSGGFGDLVGSLSLIIDKGRIKEFSTDFKNTYESELQSDFLNILNKHRKKSKTIFKIPTTIAYKRKNTNPITDFILKKMQELTKTNLSLVNSSTLNPLLIEGNITKEDLAYTCGFDSTISIIKISTEKLLKAVERSKDDHYTKLIISSKEDITKKRNIKIAMPTFIAEGGHHSKSFFPEFRKAPRAETNIKISDLAKKLSEREV